MTRIKYKYRFKTEKEFRKEFGTIWRDIVPCDFSYNMDYLLGIILDEKYWIEDGKDKFEKYHIMIPRRDDPRDTWKISKDMLVKIDIKPNYTKRKLIYG